MMWIGLSLALVISAVALIYVVWPLLKPGPAPVMVEDDRLAELLGRKDAVMKSIKDLEFDYRVGKLSEDDYQLYDQRLRRQAIGLLQQIEQAAPESAQLDAAVEAEIAQRRKVSDRPVAVPVAVAAIPVAAAPHPQPMVPAQVPAHSALGAATAEQATAVRYCTNCGSALEPRHKFCANCGTPAMT